MSYRRVYMLIQKDLPSSNEKWRLTAEVGRRSIFFKAASPMDTPRTPSPAPASAPPGDEAKAGFRTKTISTRITAEELREVEAAAERDGKSLSEWFRELALKTARQRPADPAELLLAEVWALRYALLHLFHSGAEAAEKEERLPAEAILEIRDEADALKFREARKMLEKFLAQGGQKDGRP